MTRVPATRLKGALTLAALVILGLTMHAQDTPRELFERARLLEENARTANRAIELYERVATDPKADRALGAQAKLRIAVLRERQGDPDARALFAAIVKQYGDQAAVVEQARTRLAASTSEVVVRQVWSGPGVDLQGMPSLDGRYLTFVDSSNRSGHVGIRDLTTGQNRLLAHTSGAAYPVLSPDNTEVAYISNETDLRVTRVDGTRERTLKVDGFVHSLTWAPDGRHLAAVLSSGVRSSYRISQIAVADGKVVTLKSTNWTFPSVGGYSPDGRFLVYSLAHTPPATDGGIFALAVDASRESTIVQSPNSDRSPVWTPDGRGIAFLSDRSGTQALWYLRVENAAAAGEPVLLQKGIDAFNMGFARDGTYFYGAVNVRRDVYLVGIDPTSLQVNSPMTRLSERSVGVAGSPSWSPDGRSVAFGRGTDPPAVVVRSLETGVERILSLPATFPRGSAGFGAEWFPDGKALLLGAVDFPNRRAILRRFDMASGTDTPFLDVEYIGLYDRVRFSPDGRSLYYSFRTGEDDLHLIRRDIATGSETELYRSISNGVGFFGLSISPDGASLAFNFNVPDSMRRNGEGPRALMIIPTTGGTPREIYRGSYSCPAPASGPWMPDGRHVLAVCEDGPGMRLWAIPRDGGEPRKLDVVMKDIGRFDVSPDGRIAITEIRRDPEVWSIKSLLWNIENRR